MPISPSPNIQNPDCPSHQVLERISDKWTALIIYVLSQGTRRNGELRREIQGVSQKMLTQTLRNLERDGLVERKVYPVIPPMVEYSLTPLGESLREPLCAICKWAIEHFDQVEKARSRYDGSAK